MVMGPTFSQDMTFQEATMGYNQSSGSTSALKYFGCQIICDSKFCRLTQCPDAVNNKLTNKLANKDMFNGLFYHYIGQFPVKQTLADTKLREPSHSIWKSRYLTHSHREFDIIYTKSQVYFSLQEIIKHMDTTLLKEMYVTIHSLSVLASLLLLFYIQGIKKVCALYSRNDVHTKYRWIFQYQKKIFQVLLVYPVFADPNFDQLASFSRLAIRLPGNVTCINLASAGLKLVAEDSKVLCEGCGMAVNITDIKYPPAAGIYHAHGCHFIQADSDIERKNFSCSLSTSSFEALGTSMDYHVSSQFEDPRSSFMEHLFSDEIAVGESLVGKTLEVNVIADCEVRFDEKTIETDCACVMPGNAPDKEHELDQSNTLLNLQQQDLKTDDQVFRNYEFTGHGSNEDNSAPQFHVSEGNYNSSTAPTHCSQFASSAQQLTTKPSDTSSERSEASASPQREGYSDSESSGYASDSCHDFDDTEFFQTEFEICSQPRNVSSRETCKKNPGYGDCVRCFHCGLGLRSWRPEDDIFNEHHKKRPDCQFLQMKLRVAGITGLGYLFHTQTDSEESTFQDQTSQSAGNESAQNHVVENVDPRLSMQVQMTSVAQRSDSEEINAQAKILELSNMSVPVPLRQEIVVAMVLQPSNENHSLPSTPRDPTVAILEREQQYLRQVLLCKVCLRKPAKDLFLPCGELVACLDCSKLLTHCPSCGNKVLATVTAYLAVEKCWLKADAPAQN